MIADRVNLKKKAGVPAGLLPFSSCVARYWLLLQWAFNVVKVSTSISTGISNNRVQKVSVFFRFAFRTGGYWSWTRLSLAIHLNFEPCWGPGVIYITCSYLTSSSAVHSSWRFVICWQLAPLTHTTSAQIPLYSHIDMADEIPTIIDDVSQM